MLFRSHFLTFSLLITCAVVQGRFPSRRAGQPQDWLLPDGALSAEARLRYEGGDARNAGCSTSRSRARWMRSTCRVSTARRIGSNHPTTCLRSREPHLPRSTTCRSWVLRQATRPKRRPTARLRLRQRTRWLRHIEQSQCRGADGSTQPEPSSRSS